ncbi:MAG: class IIb bacteriocin, lactobin A/cerein 7B family [Bacteroidota bacterium]
MKNLDLEQMGVQEMNAVELKETDGGLIPLLIIGGMLLLSGCAVYKEIPHESNSPEQDTIN